MIAGMITRSFERAGLRGAPFILGKLAKLPPLQRQLATVTLPSGETMSFPAFDGYWARHLYAGVPFEPDTEMLFRRFGAGRVLVDCGANIGYWSVRAKGLGFTRSIAIEANPRLIPILKRNHGEVLHRAVYSHSGETLFLGRDGPGARIIGAGSRMASKIHRLSWLGKVYEQEVEDEASGQPVQSLALNDLGLTEPCLVKLDVEGCEIPALEGADKLDAIYVYEDFPTRGAEVTRYLLDRGFKVFAAGKIIEPISDPDQLHAFKPYAFGPVNLAALRD